MARYPVLSTPSTSVQFKPKSDEFALDQATPGYRVLHLKQMGSSIHISNVWLSQQNINTEISGY